MPEDCKEAYGDIVRQAEEVILESNRKRLAAVNAEMRERLREIVIPELKKLYDKGGTILMMVFSTDVQDAFDVIEWSQMKIGVFPSA